MRLQNSIFALLCVGTVPLVANAAVTCVVNAAAIESDAKTAQEAMKRATPGCDTKALSNSLPAIRDAINTAGTKLVNTATITNTEKLEVPTPDPVPAQEQDAAVKPQAQPQAQEKPVDSQPTKVSLTWEVLASDVRLANTFERWANTVGYKIQWDAEKHFLISATPTFKGTIEDAITQALSTPTILFSSYPLEACKYEQTPPLIRITRQGEQSKECPDQFQE